MKQARITTELIHENPILSILVLTIPDRRDKFNGLIDELKRQANGYAVEIVSVFDPKKIRIGEKRNIAVRASSGLYLTFIDDDDFVSEDYISEIMFALESSPDCVGFKVKCEWKDLRGEIEKTSNAIISNRYDDWYHNGKEEINGEIFHIRQFHYHKTPVRREIYTKVKAFKSDMVKGEDYDLAKRIKPHLKTERFIDKYLYYYHFQKEPGGVEKRYAR